MHIMLKLLKLGPVTNATSLTPSVSVMERFIQQGPGGLRTGNRTSASEKLCRRKSKQIYSQAPGTMSVAVAKFTEDNTSKHSQQQLHDKFASAD